MHIVILVGKSILFWCQIQVVKLGPSHYFTEYFPMCSYYLRVAVVQGIEKIQCLNGMTTSAHKTKNGEKGN